ncbi:MAG: hypothetical protein ABIK31_02885 [candidate division WOR-3 bacterium]
MAGYRLPGVRIEEITRPGSANLSSSFRLICVIGKFNPRSREFGEEVVKSNPLLLQSGFTNNTMGGHIVSNIYHVTNSFFVVATLSNGIYITTDGGNTFVNRNTSNSGIPSNVINRVFVDSGRIFVATTSGLGVSSDNGLTFTVYNITSNPALPSNVINDVEVNGSTVYVATTNGLAISTDNLLSFVTYTTTGSQEVTQITTIADTSVSLQNRYWFLSSLTTDYYVWYNVGGGGTDPNIAGRTGIEVIIPAGSSASSVASLTIAAIGSVLESGNPAFLTSLSGSTITVTAYAAGDIPAAGDPTAGNTGWAAPVVTVNGANAVAQVTDVTFVAESSGNYNNKYFFVPTTGNATNYVVWFDVDNSLTAPVVPGWTPVEIDISSGDTANTIASAVQTALNALPELSVTVSGSTITITQNTAGACNSVSNGVGSAAAPITITQTTAGANAVAQVFTITTGPDVIGLGGKYFLIDSTVNSYYVWLNVNSSNVNPMISGRTGVVVNISAGATATAVATAVASAINALTDFTATSAANVVTATTVASGHVQNNAVDFNTGFTISVVTDGKNSGMLANDVKIIRRRGTVVYAGTNSGIRVSNNSGATWVSSITTSEGLSSNNIRDIAFSGSLIYVATSAGLDRSLDNGVTWSPTSITVNVRSVSAQNDYVYAATGSGVYLSSNNGVSFNLVTTAEGLSSNNIYFVRVLNRAVYVGSTSGLDVSINRDVLSNTDNVVVNRVGSLVNMDNYFQGIDYTYTSTGEIIWRNTSSNVPSAGSVFFVDYEYSRPMSDFLKTYSYDSYENFTRDWQFPDDDFDGNIFVYLAFQIFQISQIVIVPIHPNGTTADYLTALNVIAERNIQDLVVLSTNEDVQVAAAFHVQERSAPENAFYRMYWTGGPATYPLGDSSIPASLIGRKNLLKNKRTIFVNAPRATVRYVNKLGEFVSKQVDGAFIGGLLVCFYNTRPNNNPNVEALNQTLPGFTLFVSDYDNYYSRKKLIDAGQESLYLLEPVGSIGIPRIVDDLTTDSTTVERQNPNLVRTMDYINTDVANQIRNVFQGRLMVDPNKHMSDILTFLNLLFRQYKNLRFIVNYKDLSVTRSTERADTILINYAWEGLYSHKYTNGTTYLVLPGA